MKFISRYKALIIAFLVLALYFIIESRKSIDLKENGFISVAKVHELVFIGYVYSRFKYEYYHEGEHYVVEQSLGSKDYNEIINRYFEVKISKVNPKNSEINLNLEISDSLKISGAGFIPLHQ